MATRYFSCGLCRNPKLSCWPNKLGEHTHDTRQGHNAATDIASGRVGSCLSAGRQRRASAQVIPLRNSRAPLILDALRHLLRPHRQHRDGLRGTVLVQDMRWSCCGVGCLVAGDMNAVQGRPHLHPDAPANSMSSTTDPVLRAEAPTCPGNCHTNCESSPTCPRRSLEAGQCGRGCRLRSLKADRIASNRYDILCEGRNTSLSTAFDPTMK